MLARKSLSEHRMPFMSASSVIFNQNNVSKSTPLYRTEMRNETEDEEQNECICRRSKR